MRYTGEVVAGIKAVLADNCDKWMTLRDIQDGLVEIGIRSELASIGRLALRMLSRGEVSRVKVYKGADGRTTTPVYGYRPSSCGPLPEMVRDHLDR